MAITNLLQSMGDLMKIKIMPFLFLGMSFFVTTLIFAENLERFMENDVYLQELKTNEYIDIVRPFLPNHPTILEAGCHSGEDTIILAAAWPEGHLYAFEPVRRFIENAKTQIARDNITNVSIYPFALSSKSGKQTFYYSTNIGAASSLLESNEQMIDVCDYQDAQMQVDCVNLDEWAKKNNVDHIDFMWLDMEGNELNVLRSAPDILKTTRVILTEANFREFRKGSVQFKDLMSFLTSNGFKLHKIWGSPTWQGTALFLRNDIEA